MNLRSLFAATFCTVVSGIISAQTDDTVLSLDEQITVPAIELRQRGFAVAEASKTATSLRRHGFRTSTIRNGEVVLASIPCDTLFAANSTEPKPEAKHRLRPLRVFAAMPEKYKIVVAVHADDSGDEEYSDALTEARANAIDNLLWQLSGRDDETNVVIYGLGKDEPIVENSTRRARRANRRVEFYIVPL